MKPPFVRRLALIAACAASVVFLTHAYAAEADDLAHALQALETALHDEAAAKTSPAKGRETADEEFSFTNGRAGLTANWTAQLRAELDQGEFEQAERLLSETVGSFRSEAVLTACQKVREEMRSERETRELSVLKRYRDAVANAESAVKSARAPADLDAALQELGEIGGTPDYRTSTFVRGEAGHVQSLRRYVILWQDYLFSRQHGDNQAAVEKLLNLSQDGSAEVLPRSEILARMEELKTSQQTSMVDRTEEILGKLKTPDQIAGTVRELETDQKHTRNDYSNPGRANLGMIISELQSYAEVYNSYQAGLPTSIESLTNRFTPTPTQLPAEVQNIKAQLLRLLCVRELDLGERFKPGATESIPDYLNRLLADARERADARMIIRLREIQRQTNPQKGSYPMSVPTEGTVALQAVVAAQNQEEAGQFVPAVVSYESALKDGGGVIPAKAIGVRLDAIKSAHPAEYEQGLQISLNAANGNGKVVIPTR